MSDHSKSVISPKYAAVYIRTYTSNLQVHFGYSTVQYSTEQRALCTVVMMEMFNVHGSDKILGLDEIFDVRKKQHQGRHKPGHQRGVHSAQNICEGSASELIHLLSL